MLSSSSTSPGFFGLPSGPTLLDLLAKPLRVLLAARSSAMLNFLAMTGPLLDFGPSGLATVSRNPTHFSRLRTVHVQMTLLEESSSLWLLLNISFRA